MQLYIATFLHKEGGGELGDWEEEKKGGQDW